MYYIYKITNIINGKTYIGQHKYKELNDDYMGSGIILKAAKAKYGIENFKKDILIFNISEKRHVDLLEKTFIASEREKKGTENCYNIANGGQGGCGTISDKTKKKMSEARKGKPSNNKGKHLSEEAKKKRSGSLKGRHLSEDTKRKLSKVRKGMHYSEETKKKISEALKGKPLSEEHKKILSDAHKGQIPWNKGKHLSEEAKKKMSDSLKGKQSWNKGKKLGPLSEEHRRKISKAFKGMHWKLVDGKRIWY